MTELSIFLFDGNGMCSSTPEMREKILLDKLRGDYELVTTKIREVHSSRNDIVPVVLEPDYLSPIFDGARNVSLDNPKGELQYYTKIRNVLEEAIKRLEGTKNKELPKRYEQKIKEFEGPDYLLQLVKN